MVQLIVRRIGMMILILLVVALLLFLINEGDPTLVARSVLGPYAPSPSSSTPGLLRTATTAPSSFAISSGSAEYLPAISVTPSSTSGP